MSLNGLNDPATLPSGERIVLDRIKLMASAKVGRYLLDNMKLETHIEPMLGDMVLSVNTHFLAHTQDKSDRTVTFTYKEPTSWWQMLKYQHAPQWFTKRWPVKFDTCTIKKKARFKKMAAFPDANIKYPDSLGQPVMYFKMEVPGEG